MGGYVYAIIIALSSSIPLTLHVTRTHTVYNSVLFMGKSGGKTFDFKRAVRDKFQRTEIKDAVYTMRTVVT